MDENGEMTSLEIADDTLVAVANQAEKRINAIKRIKEIVLKVTNSNDWVDQGGRPYLQTSGGEKVGSVFGISWEIYEPELTVEEDGHYSYTYKGKFRLGDRKIEFSGSRGTKDPFFSKAHGESVPISEIDRNDIKKSAQTNLIGNGITRILGIRNLTWEELEAAGIHRGKTNRVDYDKKEMSEDAKDLRKKIGNMLLEMSDGNKEKAAYLLKTFTTFVGKDGKTIPGKSSLADVSEKAMGVTYDKVKTAYDGWVDKPKEEQEEFDVPDDFDK